MVAGSACGVYGPACISIDPAKRSGVAGTFEKPELATQRDGLIEHLDDLEAEVESLLPLLIKKMNHLQILGI